MKVSKWTVKKLKDGMANPINLQENHRILRIDMLLPQVVKNYGQIKAPPIELLKKEAFSWTQEATKDFENLKEAMCMNLVLARPNFTKKIIVECDASSHGIGEVLMQEGRPISFESNQLKGKKVY
jgi:hypothetical protein